MTLLRLSCPTPFHLRDVVLSHGWLRLDPYRWDDEREVLSRVERLPSGRLARMSLREERVGAGVEVLLETEAPPAEAEALRERARWILALDDDLGEFHALCSSEPGLREAGERGKGRILRCPTVWEDVVKTLFSVNTTWRQTIAMNRNLVAHYGEPYGEGERAFPTPEAVAAVEPEELQRLCRVGYRAGPLSLLARQITEGSLDLQALKDRSLSTEEVEARLRAIRGIGPYAAANVLLLLGHYDHLPVDSWFRKTVRDAWFGGRDVPDSELVAAFGRFRPHRSLVYYFFDWAGAHRTEVWHNPSNGGAG